MVLYYDYQGRVIQDFHLTNLNKSIRKDNQYRFNGEVLKMRMTHKKAGTADMVESYLYDYDHVGRKTNFKHSKDGITQNVAKYQFDGIGRLNSKAIPEE